MYNATAFSRTRSCMQDANLVTELTLLCILLNHRTGINHRGEFSDSRWKILITWQYCVNKLSSVIEVKSGIDSFITGLKSVAELTSRFAIHFKPAIEMVFVIGQCRLPRFTTDIEKDSHGHLYYIVKYTGWGNYGYVGVHSHADVMCWETSYKIHHASLSLTILLALVL